MWPPLQLIDNELEFEVEAMLKSRQLRKCEWEYLVMEGLSHDWIILGVDMERAQEMIDAFHNQLTTKWKQVNMW
jgi:hypothetical protein